MAEAGQQAMDGGGVLVGREVVRALPGGRSTLVREGERLMVAKGLPADCLTRGGELHGHVKDRLARVREVADMGVASLRTVEMEEGSGKAYLLWDWVEGEDLSAAFATGRMELLQVARALVSAVERLHLLGIVHGALHLRNVIVPPEVKEGGGGGGGSGGGGGPEVVLTHVSPLVIDDVNRDAADVVKILRELNARAMKLGPDHQAESAALARILAEGGGKVPELPELRERLLLAHGARFIPGNAVAIPRPRSFWAAVALAAFGAGVAALVGWWALGGTEMLTGGMP